MATKAKAQAMGSTDTPKPGGLPGQVVLVLQGGGALGAYQVGVYQAMHEAGIEPEHVMASGALPPAFPAVRVEGESYWDGGIYSNTPVEAVLDDLPRRDSLILAVQMWDAAGPEPETILQVLGRQKEIQYASRANSHLKRQDQIHRLRHVVRELVTRLPESVKDDPDVGKLASYGCATRMHLVKLVAPRLDGEDQSKDIDFTSAGIGARWEAGYIATRRMLERKPWQQGEGFLDGIVVHEEH